MLAPPIWLRLMLLPLPGCCNWAKRLAGRRSVVTPPSSSVAVMTIMPAAYFGVRGGAAKSDEAHRSAMGRRRTRRFQRPSTAGGLGRTALGDAAGEEKASGLPTGS